jgi:Fe-S-cluster-containing dehydrogenase component
MVFGDLDDPQSPIHKKLPQSVELLPSQGAKPKVFYMIPGNLSKEIEQRIIENPNMDR